MKTAIEVIGPQEAQKILAKTRENRPIRRGWVLFLADQIRRKQWQATHQGIAIDSEGYLIDGQHRLLAVIESGQAIGLLITRGLDKSAYHNIDCGLSRTTGDRLKLLSDPKSNQIACSMVRSYVVATQPKPKAGRVPIDQIENIFLSMSDEFAGVAESFRSPIPGLTRCDVGAALVCYMTKQKNRAEEFVEQYLSGEGMKKGEAPMALRDALFTRRIGYGQIHGAYWKTIFATQAHASGRDVKSIQPAVRDWRGNIYERLHNENVRRVEKGVETRKRDKILSEKASEQIRLIRDTAKPIKAAHAS